MIHAHFPYTKLIVPIARKNRQGQTNMIVQIADCAVDLPSRRQQGT
jgi:hypothetical protein